MKKHLGSDLQSPTIKPMASDVYFSSKKLNDIKISDLGSPLSNSLNFLLLFLCYFIRRVFQN